MNRTTLCWALGCVFSLSHSTATPRVRADAIASSYSITDLGDYIPTGLNNQGQVNLVTQGAAGYMGYGEFYSMPDGLRNQSAQYTYNSLGGQAGTLDAPSLAQPGRSSDGSWIYAYNAAGDVAGQDGKGNAYAILGGVRIPIGGDDASTITKPIAMNASGQVVGDLISQPGNGSQGFLYSGGVLKTIGDLGGGTSTVQAVNDSGVVVGTSTVSAADAGQGGLTRGFLYDGTIHQLGDGSNLPYAINNAGVVVGSRFQDVAGDDRLRAFMMKDGTLTDLNSLLPTGTGWLLTAALGVNDLGQIIGVGTINGRQDAFLLSPDGLSLSLGNQESPVPEPASLVCFATLALAGLIRASRRS